MRSRIFSENPLPGKAFTEHCVVLAQVPPRFAEALADSAAAYLRAPTSAEEATAIDQLRSLTDLTAEQIEAVLSLGAFFLRELEPDDSLEPVVADVRTVTRLPGDQVEKLRPFLAAFITKFGETHQERLGRATSFSVLKVLRAATRLVDLRAVFSRKYGVGDDVTAYRPVVTSLTPVAVLRLSFGDDDEAVFQMDLRTLRLLQAELEALEKELLAVVEAHPRVPIQTGEGT